MWQKTKNIYHLGQAVLANIMYGFPARGLTIIGVTGTDGKTTTSSLIYHILITSGYKAALISSNGAIINGRASDLGFHITTPGRFAIQSYIKKAKKEGVKYIVLEVTSHALDQHRVAGVHFDVGVITNVTREHLDYHKTYENYVKAKSKLLRTAKVAVVNKDDHSYWQIRKKELKGKEAIITYGMKKDADVNPHVFPFTTKLIGQFNKYNSLAAIAALQSLHLPEEGIRRGIATFKAPAGRQEVLYNKDFLVINDFAHTPNSFTEILPEVKKLASKRLIHVFGAAARRDTYKRPEMGNISARFSDIIIITSEDPRDEPIEKINKEILSGIKDKRFEVITGDSVSRLASSVQKEKKYVFVISDRKEAIRLAITLAQKGDAVLMTGKGHEKSMNYGRGEEPWDENEITKQVLRDKK
ncbi:MAG: UDP-N-acetylmuramyl-tripeptide synthetase [Candidatus Levybacteria bacterium]|nr:UDP-N-acetylmuramyl-tripeptide synthetase [Candidatus Levybacteria bacterium]